MSVDPVDDCTFWYTNQYLKTTGIAWSTRLASFKFPSCGQPPPPPDFYLEAAPDWITIYQGTQGIVGIWFHPTGNWTETVNLSVSGCPPSSECTLYPTYVTPYSDYSELTIEPRYSTPLGPHTVTVTGTGGGLSRSVDITVIVAPGALRAVKGK